MHKALFTEKTKEKIKCFLCNHYCIISNDSYGICGVRKNIKGVLYSLNYGKVIAEHIDPIEKKPLFHFLPGSLSYSIALMGCNFKCLHCQNSDISQVIGGKIGGLELAPDEVVNNAIESGCQSISYTYTEPTIFFEFAIDCMKLAHAKGLKNVWVTNGYTSTEALEKAKPYLDSVNVDLKFFNRENYLKICGAKLEPVLDNLIWYKKNKTWLEVTTLIIPGINDSDEELEMISNFIYKNLGADVPWHVSAFYPTFKLIDRPGTPKETIRRAYSIGKKAGLNYVYGGNIVDENLENTYCPECGEIIIKRSGYQIKRFDINKKCPRCQSDILIM